MLGHDWWAGIQQQRLWVLQLQSLRQFSTLGVLSVFCGSSGEILISGVRALSSLDLELSSLDLEEIRK